MRFSTDLYPNFIHVNRTLEESSTSDKRKEIRISMIFMECLRVYISLVLDLYLLSQPAQSESD